MERLPDGVVTFLFTDIEGSTRLWEEAPEQMMDALRHHDEVVSEAVGAHSGLLVKPRGEGDSQFVVFRSALEAVVGSAEMQRRLEATDWPTPRPLRIRASLPQRLRVDVQGPFGLVKVLTEWSWKRFRHGLVVAEQRKEVAVNVVYLARVDQGGYDVVGQGVTRLPLQIEELIRDGLRQHAHWFASGWLTRTWRSWGNITRLESGWTSVGGTNSI